MTLIDERFLMHRLRSTSTAGIASGALAILLWLYRYVTERQWNWDLLAIVLTFVGIKVGMMVWFRFTR